MGGIKMKNKRGFEKSPSFPAPYHVGYEIEKELDIEK
jgi:hypothetical protein